MGAIQSEPAFERSTSLRDVNLAWYFAFFVISGFCGLVYEVVWVRLAMASFGVTTALVSIVLSIFMAGLGLGSWGAGVLVRRLAAAQARRALRLYAFAELLIGCSAFAVPAELRFGRELLLETGGMATWQSWHYYVLTGLWLLIALLPWCTFLGSTFPLLMAVIKLTCSKGSEKSFSYLYLANVFGALLGTLVSAFVFIELAGFCHTLWIACSLNATVGFLALWISTRLSTPISALWSEPKRAGELQLYGLPRSAVPLMLFTTGMVSMGSEVVWMRQFTPYLGNFVYAFAIIVAVYLLATCLGARDYRRWSSSHESAQSRSIWSLLALSALIPAFGANPLLPFSIAGIGGIRIVSIFLFCALTGFVTPMLVDAWSGGEPDAAGLAYASNILGCITGPLIVSFGLEPWIGERWSLLVLALPLFGIAGVLALRPTISTGDDIARVRPRTKFVAAVAFSGLLLYFSSDYEASFPVREVYRDYAATVIATGRGFERGLLVNGTGMTVLTPITKYISHLPLAAMKRKPRNGLVICFGMGTSFRSMLSWGIPTTAVDLIPSVPKTFSYFHDDAPQLERSRFAKIVIDDGRRFLDGANEKYDVIVVDPPPPVEAPGSSLLYSREFYEVVKRHLTEDGIFQSWYPKSGGDNASTAAITKALMESFPYVLAFRSYDNAFGIHFLASMHPLSLEPGSVLASRMPARAAADFVEWGPEASSTEQFDLLLSHEVPLQQLLNEDPTVPAVTDDEPINEYFALRRLFNTSR